MGGLGHGEGISLAGGDGGYRWSAPVVLRQTSRSWMGRTRGSSGLLDDDSTEVAEDATAELISVGVEVVEPLAAAVPSLERFGQLSAIEVFEHFGDPGAGPVLVDLLSSEHDTVREWSAWAIAQLGV